MSLANDNSLASYGAACREASSEAASVKDTPIRKYQFRLCTVSCSCMVAIQTWFIYGYSIGYTAPVLNDLGEVNNTFTSLNTISYQDTFSVSDWLNSPQLIYNFATLLMYAYLNCRCSYL